MQRFTDIAHTWLAETIAYGDCVVDATLGNGHDALFLAQQIGASGQLFGFDVQKQAMEASQALLANEPCCQHLVLAGHETMLEHIPQEIHGKIQAIMFNLGWLPGSDKSVVTHADTTILALEQSLELLAPDGRMTVMLYPGHQGGDTEAQQVITWATQQQLLHIEQITLPNRPKAPILLQATKF